MVLLYNHIETPLGNETYVCIQCLREEDGGQGEGRVCRISSPYVLSWQLGSRRVIPGSVCEALINLKRLIRQLRTSLEGHVAKVKSAQGEQKGLEYYEYGRFLTNNLILVSCLARNIFFAFPRLIEKFSIQMYSYVGEVTSDISVKQLLDLFVHSRHMNLRDEYITDLVSDKLPGGTVLADEFMGHKFKFGDFLFQVEQAINSVTIKDLATRLRAGIRSLNLETPYPDIVFLVQNIKSFSELLEATIPSQGYDFIRDILFPESEIPKQVLSVAGRGSVQINETVQFRNPNVSICEQLNEKKVRISVEFDIKYSVRGRIVHSESGKRGKEVGYTDFFDGIINAFGNETLLKLANRVELLREKAASSAEVSVWGPAATLHRES